VTEGDKNESLSREWGVDPQPEKGTKRARVGFAVRPVAVAITMLVAIACNMVSRPATPPKRVRLHIQTLEDEGFSDGVLALPEHETADTLTNFMRTHLTPMGLELHSFSTETTDRSEANLVYVGLTSPGRLDEVLFNKTQLQELGRVDAVVFIWISPDCVDGDLPSTHRDYVAEHLNVTSVAFVCWWEGFTDAPFSKNSLRELGRQLKTQSHAQ
jgi:hypothetical protein